MEQLQRLRTSLQTGKPCIGSWLQIPLADTAELLARNGYDWLAIDMEHASISTAQLPNIFRAIELGGAVPMVRLRTVDEGSIKAALDAGAQGLIFPMITHAHALTLAIDYATYPQTTHSQGKRGIGYCRANGYGKDFDSYYTTKANALFMVAQIEHIQAVDNIESILQHPRLDAIFVGPYDLSASMGITGDFTHPDFIQAMQRIETSCKHHRIPLGIHVVQPDTALLAQRILEGYTFIAYGIDTVFLWQSSMRPHMP